MTLSTIRVVRSNSSPYGGGKQESMRESNKFTSSERSEGSHVGHALAFSSPCLIVRRGPSAAPRDDIMCFVSSDVSGAHRHMPYPRRALAKLPRLGAVGRRAFWSKKRLNFFSGFPNSRSWKSLQVDFMAVSSLRPRRRHHPASHLHEMRT